MYSYSYNVGGTSMSRLDQLLNRNQLIYQNLKQKLDGINRSNQNIYRNISHIQTNFSQDPLSHESSAIERETPIRNTSHRHEEESTSHQPHQTHTPLERIDEHQEVTFSQENLVEEEEFRQRRILQEEHRLYELQLMLEREKYLEQERLIELQVVKRQREEAERQSQREEMMRKIRQEQWQEQKGAELQSKRDAASSEPSDRSRKSFTFSRIEKDNKSSVKNNSIYLSKIPKTSIVEADEEIPTFRESFIKKDPVIEDDAPPKSSRREHKGKPQAEEGRESYRGKQLRELSISKINKVPEEKPKRSQLKKEPVSPQEITNQNDQQLLYGSSIIPDPHDPSDLDLQNAIARSEPRRENFGNTAYSELNSHFKLKLEQIELVPQCILFAPFNKVYRSPILQIKPGCITLQRKSKTSSLTAAGSRMRIVDGLRFKFKTVMTDEQQLLKYLFCSEQQLSFEKRESNKIAIVGGREALKKKLHMGLLAYCHQQLVQEVAQTQRAILIRLEHQAVTPNQEPFLIQSAIEADPSTRRVSTMKLQKLVNEMHEAIKRLHCSKGANKKVLRMTKLAILASDGQPLWSCSIISSNRYDYDFLRHLRVNKICWSINPLVKYYDDVKETLDSMRFFIGNRKTN